jgi:hypothetical protein
LKEWTHELAQTGIENTLHQKKNYEEKKLGLSCAKLRLNLAKLGRITNV